MAAEQRLYYGLSAFGGEAIEVRYFVKGALYLTETADLSTTRLPEIDRQSREPQLRPKTTIDLSSLLAGERMMELLALRPDLVRRLHGLNEGGAAVDLKIFRQGHLLEALPFKELLRRSAELRGSRDVLVVVHSTVGGIGDRGEPRRPSLPLKVLDSCSECTDDMPCDTECGYDPGKGGPETCGEFGAPCGGSTCPCTHVLSETWTSYYFNRAYPYSPAYYECLKSSSTGSTYYQRYVLEYRRDLVRASMICPNCPSCVSCYYHEEVIDYQLTTATCMSDTYAGCFFGRTPACWELCGYSPVCN
ncbi:MAG TPA: hypothetical protein VLV54_06740 [Thermoanaerobaculia bacterium]|nr:hypothetical protein [Thermoanaerobaculia bacterium]